jgi:hypothetical protein
MIIHEKIEIHAPLSVVWQVFSAIENWETWNSVCENCCVVGGNEMVKGSCITWTFRPYLFPIKVSPRITKCDPEREVVWQGSRLGVKAVHTFTFEEKENTVILTSSEEFSGPLLGLYKLILLPSTVHRLTKRLMLEIKNQAEACSAFC